MWTLFLYIRVCLEIDKIPIENLYWEIIKKVLVKI